MILTLSGEGEASTCVSPMSTVVGGGSQTADGASGSPGVRFEVYFTSESPRLLIDLGGGAIHPVKGRRRGGKGRSSGFWERRRSEPCDFGARIDGR
jgi:hypothetical protein